MPSSQTPYFIITPLGSPLSFESSSKEMLAATRDVAETLSQMNASCQVGALLCEKTECTQTMSFR
jgi:hypothetical protein